MSFHVISKRLYNLNRIRMSKNLLPGLTNLRVHRQAPQGGGFIIPLVGDPVPMAHPCMVY